MNLVVIGINHKTAPVEIREKFSFSSKQIVEVNRLLKEQGILSENVVLSTCNRMEIYAVAAGADDDLGSVKDFLGRYHNLRLTDYKSMFYVYRDKEAIEHLFRVASGLDSMVIGEMEILGQVKKAYQDARESRSTGKVLNRLFEKAFNTAKKIRTDTFVGHGAVSVSSAAIRLARKILGELNDKVALIIGAGIIAEQLAMYLKKNGIKDILVANRTLEKAKILTEKFSATAVTFDEFRDRLTDVDIVITSTAAAHCIIHQDDIIGLMPKRKQNPLFIIDLAVPRDVEEEVNKIDNVYLYNIDDLQKIIEQNISLRKDELDTCNRIIAGSLESFMGWWAKEKNMMFKTLIIGSRASKLAQVQANLIKDLLKKRYPDLAIEIKMIKTSGDKIPDVALDKIGDKGLFTKEIEEALLAGQIDLAVHSLKDLPVETAAGLKIAAVTKREDLRDILVSAQGHDLKSLAQKSRVGTSSLRRRAQLLHLRPDLQIMDLRGNLDTRIQKLNNGFYDAIVLAFAGVKRLGLALSMSVISLEEFLPQACQGALGVQIRQDRTDIEELTKILDDIPTHLCCDAERAVLCGLGGGCHAPIGVYAQLEDGKIIINAGVFSLDGKAVIKDSISGGTEDVKSLGLTLADKLLKSGAKEILERLG